MKKKLESATSAPQTAFQKKMEPAKQFARDSALFMNRCTKPTKKEILGNALRVGLCVLVIGGLGFIVRLVCVPVTHFFVV